MLGDAWQELIEPQKASQAAAVHLCYCNEKFFKWSRIHGFFPSCLTHETGITSCIEATTAVKMRRSRRQDKGPMPPLVSGAYVYRRVRSRILVDKQHAMLLVSPECKVD